MTLRQPKVHARRHQCIHITTRSVHSNSPNIPKMRTLSRPGCIAPRGKYSNLSGCREANPGKRAQWSASIRLHSHRHFRSGVRRRGCESQRHLSKRFRRCTVRLKQLRLKVYLAAQEGEESILVSMATAAKAPDAWDDATLEVVSSLITAITREGDPFFDEDTIYRMAGVAQDALGDRTASAPRPSSDGITVSAIEHGPVYFTHATNRCEHDGGPEQRID